MKKVLGILFVMVIMAVSALAVVTDSATVPVFLDFPEFVRLSVAPGDDGQFNLGFFSDPQVSLKGDIVKLLAEANVGYGVTSLVTPVPGYENWANSLVVMIDYLTPGFGQPGSVIFNAGISIPSTINILELGAVGDETHIADVTFTISSW
ncbi:MAG TPA: hypothetical protein PK723_05155 [Candidatus Pacearchaeota archaeon]|nr:hypothetical protein [Candidatus Pacearchaeota archaeon]